MHHDKCRHKQCRANFFLFSFPEKHFIEIFLFFHQIFGVTGLQVQDELERTSSWRLAREKMVVDLIGWSRGAQNTEK